MAVENPTQPSLPMEVMVEGLRVILKTVVEELGARGTEKKKTAVGSAGG